MKESFRLSDYDYHLPRSLIAQQPLPRRDESRLMVVDRASGRFSHERFRNITDHLMEGDVLVLNDTRVIPARLIGRRATGGMVELLLIRRQQESGVWEALVKPARRVRTGERIPLEDGLLEAEIIQRIGDGKFIIRLHNDDEKLEHAGRAPVPPYIVRKYPDDPLRELDRERYQTVYAKRDGAIAAPTAGFHFTKDILNALEKKGVEIRFVTLHVGLGTFQPIRTEDIRKHKMEPEWYEISTETAHAINAALREGRRIVAVGTTCCRALEDAASSGSGEVLAGSRWAKTYIYPPYRFRVVKALITNFHLPKSTLILLVSAFAGRELILKAYEEAKQKGYRFYSYGDAMLIK